MMRFKFNEKKAITSILYISKSLIDLKDKKIKPDLHKIFKILYFADQKHLARYGRPIVGDFYIAMDHGPVPSNIYDILKMVRGDCIFEDNRGYSNFFTVKDHYVYPKQEPDIDTLSESDIECINESMSENKHLTFEEIKKKSHDPAYCKATKDDKISFRVMAKVGGADSEMLAYIKNIAENERLLEA